MNNPFGNIDTNKSKIPLQKNLDGVIQKKKAGRPRRPNMERYQIKMDKVLHAQLVEYANTQDMNKSAIISQAVRILLNTSN